MDSLFVFGVIAIVGVAVFAVYRSRRDRNSTIEPRTGGGGGGKAGGK